jgi:hypothetical protein
MDQGEALSIKGEATETNDQRPAQPIWMSAHRVTGQTRKMYHTKELSVSRWKNPDGNAAHPRRNASEIRWNGAVSVFLLTSFISGTPRTPPLLQKNL